MDETFETDVREVWFAGTLSGLSRTVPFGLLIDGMQMSVGAVCRTLHYTISRTSHFGG